MPLIRDNEAARAARDGVALSLVDLGREAEEIIRAAHARAEQVLEAARRERERLIADAAEVGRAEGRNEGVAQGLEEGRQSGRDEAFRAREAELAGLAEAWAGALDGLEKERAELRAAAREDVVRFAIAFASRVARRAVELDAGAVSAQLAAALELALARTGLQVRVHPADRDTVALAMPDLARRLGVAPDWQIVDDPALTRGSCVLRHRDGEIDASIDTQIQRLVESAMPTFAPAAALPPPAHAAEPNEP